VDVFAIPSSSGNEFALTHSIKKALKVRKSTIIQSNVNSLKSKGENIMSTITSMALTDRKSLLRPIVLGGMFIFIIQFIHQWIVITLIQKNPFILVWQYIASGVLGNAAFEGGMATALLGVFFHLIISFVIAAVFILGVERIPLLRRYAIAGSLLYGFSVFIVMNMIVTPLSAAPPLPAPTMPWLIEAILEHTLLVGLPLGMLVRRNADTNTSLPH
jgi:hypothetical protein